MKQVLASRLWREAGARRLGRLLAGRVARAAVRFAAGCGGATWLLAAAVTAHAALFDFPTDNRALLDGRGEEFYMYVERDFEGQRTQPWEGGQFGFVRGPQKAGEGVIFTSLHEGVDIRPLRRDPAGNPLDDVRAAAGGRVVHASDQAGASNYGRYVVVEHTIEGSPIYSLYAHLASLSVAEGQPVRQGDVLGRLGFTGSGIDRARAHVHFEIALMMSRNFETWQAAHFAGSPNSHGLYNGLNLCGTDPAAILVASAKDPHFRLSRHIAALDPVFKLTIPHSPDISLLRDYPWLVPDGEPASPPAWTISFTGTGFPIRAVAADAPVAEPRVEWIKASPLACTQITRGLVGGTTAAPRLTASGKRFAALLAIPPSVSPQASPGAE